MPRIKKMRLKPKESKPQEPLVCDPSQEARLRSWYFDNWAVERLISKYVEDGCIDVILRDEIMGHASELIKQTIRTHNFHVIYGTDESSFGDLFQVAWCTIESTLYKFDSTPGHTKVFNMWCVAPDTLIMTNNGIMTIADAEKESSLKVMGRNNLQPMLQFIIRPKSETIKITTKCGYNLTSTYDHPYLVMDHDDTKWIKAGDLKLGDLVAVQYGQECFGNNDTIDWKPTRTGNWYPPHKWTSELAYSIGLLVSEVPLTSKFPEALGFSGIKTLDINFMEFLEWLGYNKGKFKSIPSILLKCTKPIVTAVLMGLFDGNKHPNKRNGNIYYTSSSAKLLEQIRVILLNYGIITNTRLDRLDLLSVDSLTFYKKIGFLARNKQIHINALKTSDSLRWHSARKHYESQKNPIWLPVTKLESMGKSVTMDVDLDGDKSMVTNGIITLDSQVAKTCILAHIKKETRDKKNYGSYKKHLDSKSIKRSIILDRFLDEAKELSKYNKEYTAILKAIKTLYKTDEKPHEGLIGKLVDISGVSRIKISCFLRQIKLRSSEFTDAPADEQAHKDRRSNKSHKQFEEDEYD